MKGARFSPGEYKGVISIRQGKSVIKRVVSFKVEGNGSTQPVEVAGVVRTGSGPAEETDTAEVVLPEIEPASVDTTGLKMRQEEQKRLWDEAAKNALGYLDHLPNFRCLQETHRFVAPVKSPGPIERSGFV